MTCSSEKIKLSERPGLLTFRRYCPYATIDCVQSTPICYATPFHSKIEPKGSIDAVWCDKNWIHTILSSLRYKENLEVEAAMK